MTISLPTQWSDGNGHIALALQRFDQLHQLFATEIWIFAQKPAVSRLNRQHALWKKAKGGPTLSTLTVETKLIPKQNGLLHGEAFSDLCGLADPKMWKGKNFWLEKEQTKTQFQDATRLLQDLLVLINLWVCAIFRHMHTCADNFDTSTSTDHFWWSHNQELWELILRIEQRDLVKWFTVMPFSSWPAGSFAEVAAASSLYQHEAKNAQHEAKKTAGATPSLPLIYIYISYYIIYIYEYMNLWYYIYMCVIYC